MRTTFAIVLYTVCMGPAALAAEPAARQEAAPAKAEVQPKQGKQQEKASWDWGNRKRGKAAEGAAAAAKTERAPGGARGKQQEKASWDWGNRNQVEPAKGEAARTESASGDPHVQERAAGARRPGPPSRPDDVPQCTIACAAGCLLEKVRFPSCPRPPPRGRRVGTGDPEARPGVMPRGPTRSNARGHERPREARPGVMPEAPRCERVTRGLGREQGTETAHPNLGRGGPNLGLPDSRNSSQRLADKSVPWRRDPARGLRNRSLECHPGAAQGTP